MIRNLILSWPGRLSDGAAEFLEFCRDTGRRVFLVSATDDVRCNDFAEHLGLRGLFERRYFDSKDTPDFVRAILTENGLPPAETAFIGRTAHSIRAARSGGVLAVAMISDLDAAEDFADAEPDVQMREFRHLRTLLDQTSRDEILVEKLAVEVRIGVPDAERAEPQRLIVSIAMVPRNDFRALADDLRQTVDYAAVAKAVKTFGADRSVKLIETLADQLADHLLGQFALAEVRLEIRKFILPHTKYVAVRVARTRRG